MANIRRLMKNGFYSSPMREVRDRQDYTGLALERLDYEE